jgi:hypothetical protein
MCAGFVTNTGVTALCKLVSLQALNLTNNSQVTSECGDDLATHLVQLKELDLSYTGIDTDILECLVKSPKLEQLSIAGCKGLNDFDMEIFQRRMPRLWHMVV